MDFEIGNLFYIIITVVAIIVGLLGKKKKPAGQGTGEEGSSGAQGFFENLEKAFTMDQSPREVVDLREEEEDIPAEVVEEVAEEELVSPTSDLMKEYEQLLKKRQSSPDSEILLSETDAVSEPLEVIHLDEEDGTDYFEVVKDFNAATAVVYSAIINRIDY
jgi:hypothetical protein